MWNVRPFLPRFSVLIISVYCFSAGFPRWWEDPGPSEVPVPSHLGLRGQRGGRVGSLQWDHEEERLCRPGTSGKLTDEDSAGGQGRRTEDNRTAPRVGKRKTSAGTYIEYDNHLTLNMTSHCTLHKPYVLLWNSVCAGGPYAYCICVLYNRSRRG